MNKANNGHYNVFYKCFLLSSYITNEFVKMQVSGFIKKSNSGFVINSHVHTSTNHLKPN